MAAAGLRSVRWTRSDASRVLVVVCSAVVVATIGKTYAASTSWTVGVARAGVVGAVVVDVAPGPGSASGGWDCPGVLADTAMATLATATASVSAP